MNVISQKNCFNNVNFVFFLGKPVLIWLKFAYARQPQRFLWQTFWSPFLLLAKRWTNWISVGIGNERLAYWETFFYTVMCGDKRILLCIFWINWSFSWRDTLFSIDCDLEWRSISFAVSFLNFDLYLIEIIVMRT